MCMNTATTAAAIIYIVVYLCGTRVLASRCDYHSFPRRGVGDGFVFAAVFRAAHYHYVSGMRHRGWLYAF